MVFSPCATIRTHSEITMLHRPLSLTHSTFMLVVLRQMSLLWRMSCALDCDINLPSRGALGANGYLFIFVDGFFFCCHFPISFFALFRFLIFRTHFHCSIFPFLALSFHACGLCCAERCRQFFHSFSVYAKVGNASI